MKKAVKMLLDNDLSVECGVCFYQCYEGRYIVHSMEWGYTNGKEGWYKEFKSFDKAYDKFAKEAFGETKLEKRPK